MNNTWGPVRLCTAAPRIVILSIIGALVHPSSLASREGLFEGRVVDPSGSGIPKSRVAPKPTASVG